MTAPPALSAEGVWARYAGQSSTTPALAAVDLQVSAGERLLLVGPNGAGKSTFIRVFAGLMRATEGRALVLGHPTRSARHLIGVVSHTTYLYEELTAMENLRFYGALYDVADPPARATELLDRVGIGQLADQRVGRLSRGQQQRVTIARALLHDPPVLLLDEPDTGLDLAAFDLLAELAASGGRTVILTTHNLTSGLRLGTRVAVLAHGRIVHEQVGIGPSDGLALTELLQQLGRA